MIHYSPFLKIFICSVLALIPVIAWGAYFFSKDPLSKRLTLITFIGGMISVLSIIIYKWSWQFFPSLDLFRFSNNFAENYVGISNFVIVPVSAIVVFMLIGLIEEYFKHLVVRIVDRNSFRSIDDAINFSIIAALGFSFLENVLYFYYIWSSQNFANLMTPVIFRSLFSTFAHVLFSGIFGYYYGVACFATPIFREELQQKRGRLIVFLHKILHLRSTYIFKNVKIAEGLLFAIILHGIFNIFLEMNWTFLIVPMLFLGFFILTYLLEKKEDLKIFKKVLRKE